MFPKQVVEELRRNCERIARAPARSAEEFVGVSPSSAPSRAALCAPEYVRAHGTCSITRNMFELLAQYTKYTQYTKITEFTKFTKIQKLQNINYRIYT